jgi:hypothetical protein
MKLFLTVKMAVLVAFLVGLANFACADLNVTNTIGGGNGITSPSFDSPSGDMITFNVDQNSVAQASQGTCVTNPMSGNNIDAILEELPIFNQLTTEDYVSNDSSTFANDNSSNESGSGQRTGERDITPYPGTLPPTPLGDTPGAGNPITPEPATLLIVGLGIAGLAPIARRYRRKESK